MKEWPAERVAEQFRLEVRQAFERENATHRTEEAAEIEQVKADPKYADMLARDPSYAAALTVRDSFYWEIYSSSDVQIVNNSVKVILPRQLAIYPDFITMFEGTSVGWTKAAVEAEVIDGEAHVVLELILIDYWDDDRAAKWLTEKEAAPLGSAEALLRHIQAARVAFATDPGGPKDPLDGLYTIEHWIDAFFRRSAPHDRTAGAATLPAEENR
jgi:hypothetical protein